MGLRLLQKNHEINFWRFRRTEIQQAFSHAFWEKNGESNILYFLRKKCEGLHQKFISKALEILVNTHLEDLPIVNVHWTFLLWIFNENLTVYLILLICNSQLCDERKIFKMGGEKISWACYRVDWILRTFEIFFYHKLLFKLRCPYFEYLQSFFLVEAIIAFLR